MIFLLSKIELLFSPFPRIARQVFDVRVGNAIIQKIVVFDDRVVADEFGKVLSFVSNAILKLVVTCVLN